MDDLIKRSDAIEVIKGNSFAPGVDYMEINGYGAIEDIRALPSADRPQGEWIRINSLYSIDKTYRCSVCGKVIYDMPMDEYYDPAYKGCPYCLTRMKGADDES